MKNAEKFLSMVESFEKEKHWSTSLLSSVRKAYKACVEAEDAETKNQLDMLADALAKIIKSKNKAKYDKFILLVEKHFPNDSIKMFGLIKDKAMRIAKGAEETVAEKAPEEEKDKGKVSEDEAMEKTEKEVAKTESVSHEIPILEAEANAQVIDKAARIFLEIMKNKDKEKFVKFKGMIKKSFGDKADDAFTNIKVRAAQINSGGKLEKDEGEEKVAKKEISTSTGKEGSLKGKYKKFNKADIEKMSEKDIVNLVKSNQAAISKDPQSAINKFKMHFGAESPHILKKLGDKTVVIPSA